ncbi:GNAT family N-acetyltransferase [candidate division KSB1 bacterium]|nr:MAG: GNAT family N-acetyltransferase [candidate division KSB1 bacterium]
MLQICPLDESMRPWAAAILIEHWGSTRIVTRSRIHEADRLPGFVALWNGEPAGLLTYRIEGTECEIVSLNSLQEGMGIGTALLEAAMETARQAGCSRLWLITTNDNLPAIGFYQRRNFAIAAVYPNALAESRRLKPEIPFIGRDGIPLRDELELERLLSSA